MFFHIGNPTPIFETEFELMKQHERMGDAVLMLQCKGGIATCLWNPQHKILKCAECRSKFQTTWKVMKFSNSIKVRELRPYSQRPLVFPEKFDTLTELTQYEYDGVRIGTGVASTLVSVLRDHQFDTLKHHALIIAELTAAIQTYDSLKSECLKFAPDVVYVFNGRISTQLPAILLCNKLGIQFRTYEISAARFNEYTLFDGSVCHDKSIFHDEIVRLWSARQAGDENELHEWFHLQRSGRYGFQRHMQAGNLPDGFDPAKRNIVIFNTSFDEYQHIHGADENEEDDNMKIESILRSFNNSTEFVFYLRVHPNLKGVQLNSQLRAIGQLGAKYTNLVVIAPEQSVDSYQLIESCEKVVTFGSTLGVEATYWGRPSIMLGSADYAKLGGVYIPSTHEETVRLIREHIPALSSDLVLKYGLISKCFSRPYEFFEMNCSNIPLYEGEKMQSSLSFRRLVWLYSHLVMFYSLILYATKLPKEQIPRRALRFLFRQTTSAISIIYGKVQGLLTRSKSV